MVAFVNVIQGGVGAFFVLMLYVQECRLIEFVAIKCSPFFEMQILLETVDRESKNTIDFFQHLICSISSYDRNFILGERIVFHYEMIYTNRIRKGGADGKDH